MLFDTHSHLYFDSLKDTTEEIITRMREKGVARAIQIGCDIETSEKAITLARAYPEMLHATVGVHPSECTLSDLSIGIDVLRSLILKNPDIIVGIGETGLDYHYLPPLQEDSGTDNDDGGEGSRPDLQAIQKAWFHAQAELAKECHLPLIIHTRDAREDTLECIREFGITHAVMHCYSEDITFAEALMNHSSNIYFSFSGILTYKKSEKVQETARMLPLDRILIETDAPFLAPQAVRGSVNDSANVRYVYERLCEIRSESPEVIEQALWKSSCRFYGWEK